MVRSGMELANPNLDFARLRQGDRREAVDRKPILVRRIVEFEHEAIPDEGGFEVYAGPLVHIGRCARRHRRGQDIGFQPPADVDRKRPHLLLHGPIVRTEGNCLRLCAMREDGNNRTQHRRANSALSIRLGRHCKPPPAIGPYRHFTRAPTPVPPP